MYINQNSIFGHCMAWKGRREAANKECLFWYSSNSAKPCGLNCNM